jgi:hypothetical protein
MRCGNNPRTVLCPEEWALIRWFDQWLRWAKLPPAQRAVTPEPQAPAGAEHTTPDWLVQP